MKKGRGKKRLIVCLTVFVIAAAAIMVGSQVSGQARPEEGVLCRDIFAYELMLLAGGYGLAAVIGGRRRKRMRKDVLSHVG